MSSRTNFSKPKSPQTHTYYSQNSTNQNRSTLKSAERDSLSSQPLRKTHVKGANKLINKHSQVLSKKKFNESLQKTYEKYVSIIPTRFPNNNFSKSKILESEKLKRKKKDPIKHNKTQSKDKNLHSRVSRLLKTIDSQERQLHDLQHKLTNEKSELSYISQQMSGKKQRDTLEDDEDAEYYQTNKSTPMHNKYSITDNRFGPEDDKDNKPKSILVTRSANYDKTPTRILSNERIIQAYSSEDSYKQQWLYLKEHVNSIESHYERKIKQLTQEIAKLTEENYRLRYRQGNAASAKEEMLERLELIYKGRIAKAEEKYEQKEKELIDREKVFKFELEEVYQKIERLQLESKHSEDTAGKVSEFKRQLIFGENENNLLKKYYSEKLQMKADELTKQKDEWSSMHKELLEEIRDLKRNIDQLSFENKKLSLSNSNQNTTKMATSLRA